MKIIDKKNKNENNVSKTEIHKFDELYIKPKDKSMYSKIIQLCNEKNIEYIGFQNNIIKPINFPLIREVISEITYMNHKTTINLIDSSQNKKEVKYTLENKEGENTEHFPYLPDFTIMHNNEIIGNEYEKNEILIKNLFLDTRLTVSSKIDKEIDEKLKRIIWGIIANNYMVYNSTRTQVIKDFSENNSQKEKIDREILKTYNYMIEENIVSSLEKLPNINRLDDYGHYPNERNLEYDYNGINVKLSYNLDLNSINMQ